MFVIAGIVLAGAALGFFAGTRRKMSFEQWTVGGRGFGSLLIWLLMAGEVYTTFSFLGASGWAYSRGGPALYILAYLILGNVVAFFLLPAIWEAGQRHRLHTLPDFFRARYGSNALAAFVAVAAVIFLVPYLQLQITGLGIIVQTASFDAIGSTPAMAVSLALLTGFVLLSGVRAVAWMSTLKDLLMLLAAVTIGIGIPLIHFGGVSQMFHILANTKPQHLIMPGATKNLTHTWFISTVLLTSLSGYIWPHTFGAIFTAREGEVLRRNAVLMPAYVVCLALMFFAGFSAVVAIPGISNGDLSLLIMVRRTFSPWLLGAIGGAGVLTAMVPAAVQMLTASALFAKNFFRPIFRPGMSDDEVARLARVALVAFAFVSFYLATHSSATLVSLLLVGYAGVGQFFPGIVLGIFWPRASRAGVACGMAAGMALVAALVLSHRDPFFGVSAGFLALCVNFLITIGVSAAHVKPQLSAAAAGAEI
jgi:SSS family solute:Na+ symporter